jgi:hypothetical protein
MMNQKIPGLLTMALATLNLQDSENATFLSVFTCLQGLRVNIFALLSSYVG